MDRRRPRKNRHASKKEQLVPVRIKAGEARPSQYTAKTPVLALVNVETGEVRGEVVTRRPRSPEETISKFPGQPRRHCRERPAHG